MDKQGFEMRANNITLRRNKNAGWICPQCDTVWSPDMSSCGRCSEMKAKKPDVRALGGLYATNQQNAQSEF